MSMDDWRQVVESVRSHMGMLYQMIYVAPPRRDAETRRATRYFRRYCREELRRHPYRQYHLSWSVSGRTPAPSQAGRDANTR